MIEPISISLEAEARELDYLTEIELLDIGVPYAMINMRRYPGADLAYRQALAHSYEWDYAVDVVFRGEAYMGSNMIARSNVFWNNPDADFSELFEFDIDLARQILADAGYEWDDEGRLLYPEALMPLIEAQAEH
jgi:peptide/nickel transport system substrate-binding protein